MTSDLDEPAQQTETQTPGVLVIISIITLSVAGGIASTLGIVYELVPGYFSTLYTFGIALAIFVLAMLLLLTAVSRGGQSDE